MPATEPSISAAVQIAWKIAAASARATGQSIGVAHFLYGIFSLENLPDGSVPPTQKDEVEAEISALQEAFRSIGIGLQDARRRVREVTQRSIDSAAAPASSASTSISRSDAVRQAFARAAGSATHVELLKLT